MAVQKARSLYKVSSLYTEHTYIIIILTTKHTVTTDNMQDNYQSQNCNNTIKTNYHKNEHNLHLKRALVTIDIILKGTRFQKRITNT